MLYAIFPTDSPFSRNKHGAYARALRCPWHLLVRNQRKKKKKRKKKEKRKRKKGKKEAEGEKKISHKEPRVKWFKVGKNGPRKADSLQSESRSVRAAWEAERMDETRRKDEPSKMGVHRRKSFGHRFGFMSGGPGLAGAG